MLYANKRGVSKAGWDRSTSGEVAQWTSKYGSLTFNFAGYQLPWGGLNEAGLMISTMALLETAPPAPDKRPPLETELWVQYQLDNSSTVEEVLSSGAGVRISSQLDGCCHFLVCDGRGDCAIIELLDGETVVYTAETLPVDALTNSTYEQSLAAWRGGSLSDDSLVRFGVAADAVTGFQPTSGEAAVGYAFDALARASRAESTAWSFVLVPTTLRVHFRTMGSEKIRSIDLGELDFACGTPVQMLDVHADLEGDISGDFGNYSHAASLEHLAGAFEKLGLGSAAEELDSWLQQMERFPCADGQPHIEPATPAGPPPVWLVLAVLVIVVPLAYRSLVRRRPRPS
jgi:choloylglycine hydrolase